MAEEGAWPSIQRLGLLSTTALLDQFAIVGEERDRIESINRRSSKSISHPLLGTAIIRDQLPMSEQGLLRCLQGMVPAEWYRLLNGKVFFWLTEAKLTRLLTARAYRGKKQTVLTVNSRELIETYWEQTSLSPINSGSTIYNPQIRGKFTFSSIDQYDFEEMKRRRGTSEAVAELAVDYSIPDITRIVDTVTEWYGGECLGTIYQRAGQYPTVPTTTS